MRTILDTNVFRMIGGMSTKKQMTFSLSFISDLC